MHRIVRCVVVGIGAIAKIPVPGGYPVDVLPCHREIGAVAHAGGVPGKVCHRGRVHDHVHQPCHHRVAIANWVGAAYRVLSRGRAQAKVNRVARAVYGRPVGIAVEQQLVAHANLRIAQAQMHTGSALAVVAVVGRGDGENPREGIDRDNGYARKRTCWPRTMGIAHAREHVSSGYRWPYGDDIRACHYAAYRGGHRP